MLTSPHLSPVFLRFSEFFNFALEDPRNPQTTRNIAASPPRPCTIIRTLPRTITLNPNFTHSIHPEQLTTSHPHLPLEIPAKIRTLTLCQHFWEGTQLHPVP